MNAAIELAGGNAKEAVPHQTKAVEALAKVTEQLDAANDASAPDKKTALAQAKAQAQALAEKLEKLAAKPPTTQPATQAGKPPEPKKEPEAKGELSKLERQELGQKAVDDAARLARQLAARELRKGDKEYTQDVQKLQDLLKNPDKLSTELEKATEATDKLAGVTARISNKLEAELQANIEAKRLFDAQREECPPEYRQFVNRYFEVLSTRGK